MGRLEWIVPLVVMVVYALSAILKAKEQANPQVQQPVRRNPGQELDRFLQEIDRLRRQQESRPPTAQRQSEEEEDEEEPTAQKPVIVVREQRPAPLLPRPVVLRVQPATPPAPPVAPQFADSAARTPQVVLPSFAPNVASVRGTGPNPAVMALHLLRSRKIISTAFVLNEILGPPKCKQK
jgi:hypothetical protein